MKTLNGKVLKRDEIDTGEDFDGVLEGLLGRLHSVGPRELSDHEMLELYSALMGRIEGASAPADPPVAFLEEGQDRLDRAVAQVLRRAEPDPVQRTLRIVRTELQARSYQRLAEGGLLP